MKEGRGDAARSKDGRPNVLFIICDDLNNTIPGFGRTPVAVAPNLERLAAEGVRFTAYQSNCPLCLPSRNSLLSGLYPHTTGHLTLWDHWSSSTRIEQTGEGWKSPWFGTSILGGSVMLPEHFRRSGYRTYGTGKVHHEGKVSDAWWDGYGHGPDYGPHIYGSRSGRAAMRPDRVGLCDGEPLASYADRYNGLDRFFLDGRRFRFAIEMAYGPLEDLAAIPGHEIRNSDGTPYRLAVGGGRDLLPDEHSTQWAVDALRREGELRRSSPARPSADGESPFFLAVGYMKPHTPLNVPRVFFDRYRSEEIELPPFLENDIADCARAHVEHRPYGFLTYGMLMKRGIPEWRSWLHAYLACVSFIDDQIGTLLGTLEEQGLAEDTFVVFTSDNGYHMGEKEYLFKDTLWEEACEVPLIVRGPRVAQGAECRRPASHIDLYPTLADLCGLPADPHAATHGHPLEGHSLAGLLADPANGKRGGSGFALSSVRGDTGSHHSVRSEQYRYILCGNGEEEFYDHLNDPYEWRNIAGSQGYALEKARHRAALLELIGPVGRAAENRG
jgi:arylsulfatase A-like enzyme